MSNLAKENLIDETTPGISHCATSWRNGYHRVSAFADSGQWRWAVGAQLDPASHGIVDLGYRTKDFSIQWLTDTLDVRYKKRW